jgi:type II secretory pathway component PulK
MNAKRENNGSVLLVIVFAIALMAMVTVGILQMSTEELMLMHNQLYAEKAMCIAEAGLNDAFKEIRTSSSWTTGFANKSFPGYGTYTVTVTGTLPSRTITSTATSSQGYVARVRADVTVGTSSPYIIRIDNLRINE